MDMTLTDKIKNAVAYEFKYNASQGRTNYSMEEVIYIVSEVIDEVAFEQNEAKQNKVIDKVEQNEAWDPLYDVDLQIRIINGDLQVLTEKVNKLSSLLEEHKREAESYGEH